MGTEHPNHDSFRAFFTLLVPLALLLSVGVLAELIRLARYLWARRRAAKTSVDPRDRCFFHP